MFSALLLSLKVFDAANVAYVGVAHFFQLGNGLSAAAAGLAVNEDGSGFVMQEVYGVVDFADRNVAGASYMSAAEFVLCPHIQKDGTLGCAAAVDFLVDVYSFKNIQN